MPSAKLAENLFAVREPTANCIPVFPRDGGVTQRGNACDIFVAMSWRSFDRNVCHRYQKSKEDRETAVLRNFCEAVLYPHLRSLIQLTCIDSESLQAESNEFLFSACPDGLLSNYQVSRKPLRSARANEFLSCAFRIRCIRPRSVRSRSNAIQRFNVRRNVMTSAPRKSLTHASKIPQRPGNCCAKKSV